MGGSVEIFVLDFFSKQMPRATTAGQLSHFLLCLRLCFLRCPWESGGERVSGKEGETSVGKLGSPTLFKYGTVPM